MALCMRAMVVPSKTATDPSMSQIRCKINGDLHRVSVSVCARTFPVHLYDSFAQCASGAVNMQMLCESFFMRRI